MNTNNSPTKTPSPVKGSSGNFIQDFTQSRSFTMVLVVLVILLLLGINVVYLSENILTYIWNFIRETLAIFGYSIGSGIDITANATTDATKIGLDIVGGAVADVGLLLKQGTQIQRDRGVNNIDGAINRAKYVFSPRKDPDPSSDESSINKPISSNKNNWCLVAENDGKRNCVEVGKEDKCMSGQVYPDQAACIRPK